MVDNIPEKADFEKALNAWLLEAEKEGILLSIFARMIYTHGIGDYPGPFPPDGHLLRSDVRKLSAVRR